MNQFYTEHKTSFGVSRPSNGFRSTTSVVDHRGRESVSVTMKQNRSGEDYLTLATIGDMKFYGVYDGHGCSPSTPDSSRSKHVAIYLKDYFHHYIADCLENVNMNDDNAVKNALTTMCINLDRYLFNAGGLHGSTCCCVFTSSSKIYIINLGDSHCLILDDKNTIVFESVDHTPESERTRICAAGGMVKFSSGLMRVDGILAMSRSFGDFNLKRRGTSQEYRSDGRVTPEPDVTIIPYKKGLVLVIGTDGLFCDNSMIQTIRSCITRTNLKNSSVELMEQSQSRNSNDDTAIIVAHL